LLSDQRKKLRIAQVSPLFESVPPRFYGGTERVVSNLTEELVSRGHEVTLFASGDSLTSARLRAPYRKALRLDSECREYMAPHFCLFEVLRKEAANFDVVHFHTEVLHFNMVRSLPCASVTTLHGRLDYPEYRSLFWEFRDLPLVSISDSQRQCLNFANWVGTIHHGLPSAHITDDVRARSGIRGRKSVPESSIEQPYLAFLGRISAEKRFDLAVEIARRTGYRLKVAAKIDREHDLKYLNRFEHLLREPFVDFIGEIGEREKPRFLSGAKALLFPIDWPEPFGLVLIEALACGTPVVAFNRGSVPEILRDKVTGFIVENLDEACEAVRSIDTISRARCQAEFESRFSIRRMVDDYENLYLKLIHEQQQRNQSAGKRNESGARAPSLGNNSAGMGSVR
jgi:glycosyltransferase involved in cell wall biosynthesis